MPDFFFFERIESARDYSLGLLGEELVFATVCSPKHANCNLSRYLVRNHNHFDSPISRGLAERGSEGVRDDDETMAPKKDIHACIGSH